MAPVRVRTMDDFALASGLSRPTVAKYFRDPDSVRPSTRRAIEAALERFDYRPNMLAASLNREHARIVGVVIPSLADPFYAEILRHVEHRCAEAGYLAIALSSHGEPALELRAIETLRSLQAAGIVLAPLGTMSDAAALRRLSRNTPVVYLDTAIDDDVPFVGTDNRQSVARIVAHLARANTADAGPGFLEMPGVNRNAGERRAAYLDAMAQLGLQPALIAPIRDGWDFEAIGHDTMAALLDANRLPAATILCANDRLAFGALAACFARGRRVGADATIRIAGHDDHPLSRFTCPGLTTVAQDYDALGRGAVDMLLHLVGKGGAIRQTRLAAQLVERASA